VGHVVFGLFFALTIVCTFRGIWMFACRWLKRGEREEIDAVAPALVREA